MKEHLKYWEKVNGKNLFNTSLNKSADLSIYSFELKDFPNWFKICASLVLVSS